MSGIEPNTIRYLKTKAEEISITETYVLKDKTTRQYVMTADTKTNFLSLGNSTAKSELVGLADTIEEKSAQPKSAEPVADSIG